MAKKKKKQSERDDLRNAAFAAAYGRPTDLYPGYAEAHWTQVRPGMDVYLAALCTVDAVAGGAGPHAEGPFTVVSVEDRLVRAALGETRRLPDAGLLLKNGPPVVVSYHDKHCLRVYADVPLSLVLIEELSSPATHKTIGTRPLNLSLLPSETNRHIRNDLGRGWEGLYGQFSVERALPAVADRKKILVVRHGAVAKALAIALVARNTSFQYTAREADGVFYLDPDDWDWALQQVPDRTIVGFKL